MSDDTLIASRQCRDNRYQSLEYFLQAFEARKQAHAYRVEPIAFAELERWHFDEGGNLRHESGRFFSIEGLHVESRQGCWQQPIIHQPEVGILGILSRVVDGVRYFLMQAKMEPGNINTLQLSPTVQATHSNFTGVHAGRKPPYLDYFLNPQHVLVDTLQAEQGARFYRKKNRNLIVEIDHDIEVHTDFFWLTLNDIQQLLQCDNVVNMDSRSVLGCLPYGNTGEGSLHSDTQVLQWLTKQGRQQAQEARLMPLRETLPWQRHADRIQHPDNGFFSVMAVRVQAGSREVPYWTQPMIADPNPGLIGFITSRIDGVLHCLVQAKTEPGNHAGAELVPTVSCSYHSLQNKPPPFAHLLMEPPAGSLRYSALQSEEGGRFYHVQNRNTIIELAHHVQLEPPAGFLWATPEQLRRLMPTGAVGIDARTLLSCLPAHG